jgi:hypothetical protein
MNGRPWRDDQIAELRRLWERGLTGSEIAQSLGMSRGAVIGKLNRLGLIGNMPKTERLKRVRRAASIGLKKFWTSMSPEQKQKYLRRLSIITRSWRRSATPQEQQTRNAKVAAGYWRWRDSLNKKQRTAHIQKRSVKRVCAKGA